MSLYLSVAVWLSIHSSWRDEAAFWQELLMLVLAPLTLWLRLPLLDTALLLALMGLVLVAELLNSSLEVVVDMAMPEIHGLAHLGRRLADPGRANSADHAELSAGVAADPTPWAGSSPVAETACSPASPSACKPRWLRWR